MTLPRRLRLGLILVVVLIAAGLGLRPLESRAWSSFRAAEPAFNLRSLEGAMGQGITLGILGGFRAVAANLLWLQMNAFWEDNDLPATQTTIRLVTTVDPRPLYFWLNGARIIGYDMPNWRITARGGYDSVPESVQRRIDEEQAAVALDYLDLGLRFHPAEPLILIDQANLHLRRRKDERTAAALYLEASRRPDAPWYAARIHAELLRSLGEKAAAYRFLRELLPTLPRDNAFAMPWVVYDRIRELEEELNLPPSERLIGERPTLQSAP